jgi:hypothetical protein
LNYQLIKYFLFLNSFTSKIALNNLSKYTHDGKSITTIEIEKAILEVNELRNKKY